MAVTVDDTTHTADAGTNSAVFAHSPAGAATDLSVRVIWSPGTIPITAVTWNGVACTAQGTPSGGTGITSQIFTLNAPATGSHNVSVTWGSAVDALRVIVQTYLNSFGVAGSSQDTGSDATPTVTVPNVNAADLVIDAVGTSNALTVGAGQTEDVNGAIIGGQVYAGSTQPGSTGGVMSWSHAAAVWVMSALRVKGTSTPDITIPVFVHHLRQQGIA